MYVSEGDVERDACRWHMFLFMPRNINYIIEIVMSLNKYMHFFLVLKYT